MSALVPTTSIWSTQDEIIMPNSATSASAMMFPYNLLPAANFAVQSVAAPTVQLHHHLVISLLLRLQFTRTLGYLFIQ
jgi:hypothetical protein